MNIEKFSIGIGDRFGQEGAGPAPRGAEGRAGRRGRGPGLEQVVPRALADRHQARRRARRGRRRRQRGGWKHAYYVDADHIGVKTVDGFLAASDFFTLDVADFIGKPPDDEASPPS